MNAKTSATTATGTVWKLPGEPGMERPGHMDSTTGLSDIVLGILAGRGIRDDAARADFLEPQLRKLGNPSLFRDMDLAASRAADAVTGRENVCIYGDYDADGMTSTAVMKLFFAELGLAVRTFLPDREADGYGLHESRIAELARDGVTLIICVDCGIKSVEAAQFASTLGVDLVILDHHIPGDRLPAARAVVDPHRADCPFPFKDLAAVGICFYFCGALRKVLVERGMFPAPGPDIRNLLDLVAIGTIADVMPLLRDNRIFVKAGLERINTSPRPGIAALRAVSGIRGPVTSGNVSFKMAPRLNASGRMSHPDTSLRLLTAPDDRDAATWAEALDADNSLRREVGSFVLEEARKQIFDAGGPDGGAIVAAGPGWHPGVLGIVAARLVEEFCVPSIVLSIDEGIATGSGRSVDGFDIGAALASLEYMLLRTGGHPMAAGLSMEMARFDDFVKSFKTLASNASGGIQPVRILHLDAEVRLSDLDARLISEITRMEPFGMDNPEPVLLARGVTVTLARKVGKDGTHKRFQFMQDGTTVDGIWFGGADNDLGEGDVVDVAFCLAVDMHTGGPSMKIRDARKA